MTESAQTVPVPVDLLKRIASEYGPISELNALIPTPPKVGDALTAAQAGTLPQNAVVIDAEGDVWVKYYLGTKIYLAMDGTNGAVEAENIDYGPYTLVYLAPRD